MRRSYKGIEINTSKNTHETVYGLIDKTTTNKVMDIPSGNGAFILRLKDNGFNDVVAVDIDNILQFEHEPFILGDMTKPLPFHSDSFNTVVCIDGIEHISRQFDFVQEVHRILATNGEFIVSTPNISSIRSRWRWLFSGHHHKCNTPLDEDYPSPLHHIGMISVHEMRYMLHTSGFKITQVRTNRIKAISWFYSILVPFIYLNTYLVYRRSSRKQNTAQINKEILHVMFSKAVLFGETLIVRAIKI